MVVIDGVVFDLIGLVVLDGWYVVLLIEFIFVVLECLYWVYDLLIGFLVFFVEVYVDGCVGVVIFVYGMDCIWIGEVVVVFCKCFFIEY